MKKVYTWFYYCKIMPELHTSSGTFKTEVDGELVLGLAITHIKTMFKNIYNLDLKDSAIRITSLSWLGTEEVEIKEEASEASAG